MSTQTWTIACNLGDIVGPVTVDREENSAAIATATIHLGTGVDISTYIGSVMTLGTIFSGRVNTADYDETTGVCVFRGKDLLQETLEAMTEAQILAAIVGGKYSVHVFGDREDGWQQANDIISTVTKEMHLNGAGTLTVTDWGNTAPGSHPTTAVWGTPKRRPARYRDMVNTVNISVECRFTRLHHREHTFSWTYGHASFCTYFFDPHTLPLRDMVQSAADGAGWTLQGGIVYETLPDSGVFTCGGGPVAWTISEENQNIIVASAGWTCVKRWTQTVTETYTLAVSNSASVADHGALIEEDGASYTEDYDDGQWDQSIAADTPSGAGWAVNGIGDYTKDEITRAETDEVIETLLARAAARIAATHRRNFLDYELPYDATVDIGDAAGSGTVYQLTHRLDPTSGRATTLLRIAYSSTTGGSSDALDAPSPPDTSPSHGAPDTSTTLPTRIGSVTGAPPMDEDWEGYTGNVILPDQGAEVYDNRFRVVTPDIEDESRDEVTAEAVAAYGVTL